MMIIMDRSAFACQDERDRLPLEGAHSGSALGSGGGGTGGVPRTPSEKRPMDSNALRQGKETTRVGIFYCRSSISGNWSEYPWMGEGSQELLHAEKKSERHLARNLLRQFSLKALWHKPRHAKTQLVRFLCSDADLGNPNKKSAIEHGPLSCCSPHRTTKSCASRHVS